MIKTRQLDNAAVGSRREDKKYLQEWDIISNWNDTTYNSAKTEDLHFRFVLISCGVDPVRVHHNKLVVGVIYGLDPHNNMTTE